MAKPPDHGARTHGRGQMAETAAALYLLLKGYRIRARRYRTPVGEIDLIVSKGGVTVFVEVKWRPSIEDGLHAVSPKAQGRLRRAAEHFLTTHSETQSSACRFDLLVLTPRAWPRHVKNAWT